MNWLPEDPRQRRLVRKWILVGPVASVGALQFGFYFTGDLAYLNSIRLVAEYLLSWSVVLVGLCVCVLAWPFVVARFPFVDQGWMQIVVSSTLMAGIIAFLFVVLILQPLHVLLHQTPAGSAGSGSLGAGIGNLLALLFDFIWTLGVMTIPRLAFTDLAPGAFTRKMSSEPGGGGECVEQN